ncbi:sugar kinase [Parahaliea maris]|uniref:sugar kinase n=1 Tax=Parahaliea maris TaxID=2716870 RepID=UPI001F44CACB|nr:sugar kinase [Parahaliea maris]
MNNRPRVAAIGECMLELSGVPGQGASRTMTLGYGGDTLNTAVYMARLGMDVDYVTALGDDQHSQWMLDAWQAEGVGVSLVTRLPGRVPGLYMIDTDPDGERHFSYWRSAAPARELFDDDARVEALRAALSGYRLVYLSGITLSLYPPAAQEKLFALLAGLRQRGVKVAFDGNYRPAGWPDGEAARRAFSRACETSDMVLPTFEDEQALFGDAGPGVTLARIAAEGAGEIVLKQGPAGCRVKDAEGEQVVAAQRVETVVDTTAAGDSFNAGYLAGRLSGLAPADASRQGHALAARVIQVRGAILPREQMPDPVNSEAGQ